MVTVSSPVETGDAGERAPTREESRRWSAVYALVASALVTVFVLGCLVGLLLLLGEVSDSPESALSLVFVAAAVVLILVVCTLTIVLKRLQLSNPEEAMGLPRGSIRAVIALLLILLFFIAAIFLFSSTRDLGGDRTGNRELEGIDATRFAAIPTESIKSSDSRTVGEEVVYDVVLYPESGTQTSDDIAKQLITVLGTLVTAVAAFYFGANSVSSAFKQVSGDGGTVTAADDTPDPGPGTTTVVVDTGPDPVPDPVAPPEPEPTVTSDEDVDWVFVESPVESPRPPETPDPSTGDDGQAKA